jgi:ATP-dependent exoDNAse (exonuclease V) beta subunit
MIFQGAIDLLAVGEEVRIIDYKYSTRNAVELRAHYMPQLELYRATVAKILRIEPRSIRCSIVNIRQGFQVDMD